MTPFPLTLARDLGAERRADIIAAVDEHAYGRRRRNRRDNRLWTSATSRTRAIRKAA